MKSFILLAALAFSGVAAAESCRAGIEGRSGIEAVFDGRGYDYNSACMDAQRQCKQELAMRQRGGRSPHLSCRILSIQPTPPRPVPPRPIPVPPRGENCVANMKARDGRIIDTFMGVSMTHKLACDEATRKCERDLFERQRSGRNPYAYCEIERGYNPNPFPTFYGSCNFEKVDRFGYINQRFYASATGYSQYEATETACRDAERQCQVTVFGRSEYCRKAF